MEGVISTEDEIAYEPEGKNVTGRDLARLQVWVKGFRCQVSDGAVSRNSRG